MGRPWQDARLLGTNVDHADATVYVGDIENVFVAGECDAVRITDIEVNEFFERVTCSRDPEDFSIFAVGEKNIALRIQDQIIEKMPLSSRSEHVFFD